MEQNIKLEPENELRFEVQTTRQIHLALVDGKAEIFGTELVLNKKYTFTGIMSAVFTWQGCTLHISGDCKFSISKESSLLPHIRIHAELETKRKIATENNSHSSRVMICGPTDSGKSSLSKILLNYSLREGHTPTFVDLDVGQGAITIPSTLSAAVLQSQIDIEDAFLILPENPIVYYFGHVSPGNDVNYFKNLSARLSETLKQRYSVDDKARRSGMIINTCGWVDGIGYDLLVQSARDFEVDTIISMADEELYKRLNVDFGNNDNINIIKIQRSSGVVVRDRDYRKHSRNARINEYFYGLTTQLKPYQLVVPFTSVSIYQLKPGEQPREFNIALEGNSNILFNSMLGISHALNPTEILTSNIAGFVFVSKVNLEKGEMLVLSPSPDPMPSKILILATLKWQPNNHTQKQQKPKLNKEQSNAAEKNSETSQT